MIEDVFTYYMYEVQCKMYEFIKNEKIKGIVAEPVLRAQEIRDDYVCIYSVNKDIALMSSVNNYHVI